MASDIGARINQPEGSAPVAAFFGEDQGRYVMTAPSANVDNLLEEARKAGVSLVAIGTTGGDELKLGDAHAISVKYLKEAHEGWLPGYMQG